MAKYSVMMSCGHEDTIELLGKEDERQRKIAYLESNGLCKECYKRKMQERATAEGFVFNASALPYIDDEGSILVSVWFSGDTKPHKDEIKSLGGYMWSERKSADDYYGTKSIMCWNKIIKFENLQEEVDKAVSIGANNTVSDSGIFAMANYKIAAERQKEWKEKQDKIKAINKPSAPSVLKGHKWNQKIYGKSGNYSVYPDGEKVMISNEQAEEIKEYLKQKAEYKKKVEEIQNV